MEREDLLKALEAKYAAQGQNMNTYLKGLLFAKPINYWDYVEVDTLLSLQKPRTDYADEEIFIVYHQITELVLKLILHELKQTAALSLPAPDVLEDKLGRIIRYTGLLINSFSIMQTGMSYDDYNEFRNTLAPASGFQSAQFRFIEFYCTRVPNLINQKGKERLPASPGLEDYFEQLYWKDAGYNRQTGEKSLTLLQFEEKYQADFMQLARALEGNTLEDQVERLQAAGMMTESLLQKLKELDKMYNIEWPKVHLNTAKHYLDSKGENKAATGGSEWKKYLHPMYQQRKFFPSIWSVEELAMWGRDAQNEAG
jgi:tryptophan 2,3-dioxygenase